MNDDQIYELAAKLADEAFGNKGHYFYSERQELTAKFNDILQTEFKKINSACSFYISGMDTSGKCINCGKNNWEH